MELNENQIYFIISRMTPILNLNKEWETFYSLAFIEAFNKNIFL
jgi:hypothetical protein